MRALVRFSNAGDEERRLISEGRFHSPPIIALIASKYQNLGFLCVLESGCAIRFHPCIPLSEAFSVNGGRCSGGLDTNLRGISVRSAAVNGKRRLTVWASGSNGVILRSIDDGNTWQLLSVAEGGSLDFRDIEGFGADTAYVMSSGDSDKSRIYKTTDGGKTWLLQYSDKRAGFFLDSLACDSRIHCVALKRPGRWQIPGDQYGRWRTLEGIAARQNAANPQRRGSLCRERDGHRSVRTRCFLRHRRRTRRASISLKKQRFVMDSR